MILSIACQETNPEDSNKDKPSDKETVTIVLDQSALTLPVGGSRVLKADVSPAGKTVDWTSDKADVARVDDTGKVTGVKAGSAVITAAAGDCTATCNVTVVGATAELFGNLSSDAAILNGAGGETVVTITTTGPWSLSSESTWLSFQPSKGESGSTKVTLRTDKNAGKTVRDGILRIESGKDNDFLAIRQSPNIFTRKQTASNTMTNGIKVSYNGTVWTRIYTVLPVPRTNQYQDITDFSVTPGTVMECPDGVNSYAITDLRSDFPASGGNVVTESFKSKVYELTADLDLIKEIPDYDPDSEPCRLYLRREENGLVDPENAEIVSTSALLWSVSDGNLVTYARKCCDWTASHMNYGNMNTGLHTIDILMKTKTGDCGNFASVFISLLRAKGIPARHIVMISPQESGYHVRAEFYLPTYGWIPADPNFHKYDPGGNYFGKFSGKYIIMSQGINLICKDADGKDNEVPLLQVYDLWYWFSSEGKNINFEHVFSRF